MHKKKYVIRNQSDADRVALELRALFDLPDEVLPKQSKNMIDTFVRTTIEPLSVIFSRDDVKFSQTKALSGFGFDLVVEVRCRPKGGVAAVLQRLLAR